MKRTIGTVVLFVLLILTVVALNRIGAPKNSSALEPLSASTAGRGSNASNN